MQQRVDVHVENRGQQFGSGVLEQRVAQDAGVVDEDVESTVRVECGVDECSTAVPGHRAADVVDHDFRAAGGKQQRVLPAETAAAAGAGDDGDPDVSHRGHQLTGSEWTP